MSNEEAAAAATEAGATAAATAATVATAPSDLEKWDEREKEKWTSLERELSRLDPSTTPTTIDFIRREIRRRRDLENPEFVRVDTQTVRLVQKLFVPVHIAPSFNFVGRILGPGGRHMREIAKETGVKLAIQGMRSSKMKEPGKEAELAASGDPAHDHLNYPLHVRVESSGPPSQAWSSMQRALIMLQPLMYPSDDARASRPPRIHSPAANGTRYAGTMNELAADMLAMFGMSNMGQAGSVMAGYPGGSSSFGKMRGRGRGRGRGAPY